MSLVFGETAFEKLRSSMIPSTQTGVQVEVADVVGFIGVGVLGFYD
jgi:hypothetical protein